MCYGSMPAGKLLTGKPAKTEIQAAQEAAMMVLFANKRVINSMLNPALSVPSYIAVISLLL